MSFIKLFTPFILLLLFSVVVISCVKDVDLDQTEEIALTPDLQVSLLIFDVTEGDFKEVITNQFSPIIRDTVRLEFLDDSYIQDDLTSVEFKYKYTNTFSQKFRNTISFLSEQDAVQHSVSFDIAEGNKNNPIVTELVDFIENERIDVIKNSIKMVVEIEVLPDLNAFEGELKFESKGLFSFEF